MKTIIPPSWKINENRVTSESVYQDRRNIMKAAGLGIAGGLLASTPSHALLGGIFGGEEKSYTPQPTATDDLYPAQINPSYSDAGRPLTDEKYSARYNNFYEFGSHKEIADRAQALKVRPWQIKIEGLVEKELLVDIDDLIRRFGVEERIYRHRCVEAWSMTVPWSGFPLAKLVAFAKPLSGAKYLQMQTFVDKDVAPGHKQTWYPWPYTEALTMKEASHDLSFMVTGAYGKSLLNQFGAPLRLAVPWKYGFKHIKSITTFTFTDKRPTTFWEEINAKEYGFWANVNPKVNHPRWSQASERVLGTDERIPTELYNGYAEQVAALYSGLEGQALYM